MARPARWQCSGHSIGGVPRICPSSPGYRDYQIEQFLHLIELREPDGCFPVEDALTEFSRHDSSESHFSDKRGRQYVDVGLYFANLHFNLSVLWAELHPLRTIFRNGPNEQIDHFLESAFLLLIANVVEAWVLVRS
jgi:hypothetical protein